MAGKGCFEYYFGEDLNSCCLSRVLLWERTLLTLKAEENSPLTLSLRSPERFCTSGTNDFAVGACGGLRGECDSMEEAKEERAADETDGIAHFKKFNLPVTSRDQSSV